MKKIDEIKFSHIRIRWALNLFPPLFFNRISIIYISDDFKELKVRLRHSFMNKNFHRAIFGGSIFSAVDPYFPTMYWHIFSRLKLPVEVWLKSAFINYKRPAKTDLNLHFQLKEEDINKAKEGLKSKGKYECWHEVKAIDEYGTICAEAKVLVFLSNYKKFNINGF